MEGKDELGYDLEYLPKGAKKAPYVDVKMVGSNDSFHISSNDVHIGKKLKNRHEIFLVSNLNDIENLEMNIIIGLFNYEEGKSFTDNDKFSVQNDNFTLKFKKILIL